MKGIAEFPALDVIGETDNLRVMQDADDGFYIIGEEFMLWVEDTEKFVEQLLKFEPAKR